MEGAMVTDTPTQQTQFPDRWTPIPANGAKCEWTGLGHGRCYQLLNGLARKHVRTASIREPGASRGTRLFHVGDMLRFLDALARKQADAPTA